jgi:hypothetical protein
VKVCLPGRKPLYVELVFGANSILSLFIVILELVAQANGYTLLLESIAANTNPSAFITSAIF